MGYGERIAKLRLGKKMTQEELAKRLGITRASLSHYEKDRREPDYETTEKIADFFDVQVDYLLGRTDQHTSSIQSERFTENELQILEEMKKYPVFFHDLASDPTKISKVMKMWEFIRNDIEDDSEEEPQD
ncbi:helix-turn-helix domain-containing protein [Brevibacillus daliensis]|uniref:helix-turn-helix domain-containing protein n=1 Tax=Brevibacillus daliensis TaxID=2892995 RepID=UPI001E3D243B|nr:helix-turn-helix transcriptional regulator [Brevibacillus daliensis]